MEPKVNKLHEQLSSKPSKPPVHPSVHLPMLSPLVQKPRFTILSSAGHSRNSNLGRINSNLTPNSFCEDVSFPNIASSRSVVTTESTEENEMTDIEKIIQDQMYFKNKIRKNRLIKSTELCIGKEKVLQETRGKSQNCDSFFEELILKSQKEIRRKSPEKIKKVIVPDIPKTKFGVHKDYNDLDVESKFKTVELPDKPQEKRFRSRADSLSKEQDIRMKILTEIVSTKRGKTKSII